MNRQREIIDHTFAEKIIAACLQAGADYLDGYVESNDQYCLEAADGSELKQNQRIEAGIGIRIFANNRMAFFATSDLTGQDVFENIDKLLKMLQEKPVFPEAEVGPFAPFQLIDPIKLEIYDPMIESLKLPQRLAYLQQVAEHSRQLEAKIKWIICNKLTTYNMKTTFFNSTGMFTSYQSTAVSALVAAIGHKDGKSEFAYSGKIARHLADLSQEGLARALAQQIDLLLEGESGDDGQYDLIMAPIVAGSLLNQIGEMLKADNYLAGHSYLAGQLHHDIAAKGFNLASNGIIPRGNGTVPFDGEGLPGSVQELVTEGTLVSLLHSRETARAVGSKARGFTRRFNFRTLPVIGWPNLEVLPGVVSEAAMLQSVEKGIYLTNVLDIGRANHITGKFEVKCTGYLIEKGQLGRPLNSFYYWGQIDDILRKIVGVGRAREWAGPEGNILTPALCISDQLITF